MIASVSKYQAAVLAIPFEVLSANSRFLCLLLVTPLLFPCPLPLFFFPRDNQSDASGQC